MRWPIAMLTLVRLVHTAIFVVMATSVLFILVCGIAGLTGATLWVALALVGIECAVFAGNGFKCPLTGLAKRYGAEKGYVFDTFFPERWTRYTVPVFTSILVLGLLLIGWRALR